MAARQQEQQQGAQDGQSCQEEQRELQHVDRDVREPHHAGQQVTPDTLSSRRPVPGRGSLDRAGDGVEGVAALLQVLDQAVQRLHRLGPLTATVVEHDHGTLVVPRQSRRRGSCRPPASPSPSCRGRCRRRGSCRRSRSPASPPTSSHSTLEEYGARRRSVVLPVTAAIASWVWSSSQRTRHGGTLARFTWVNVCTPTSWPSACIRRTRSGRSATRAPRTKNVAFTRWAARTSRIFAVHSVGPSSKVRTTCRSGTRRPACGVDGSTIGPPSANLRGHLVRTGLRSRARWQPRPADRS